MMLLDSNILIYAVRKENETLRDFIEREAPAIASISIIETLGYHGIAPEERHSFASCLALP